VFFRDTTESPTNLVDLQEQDFHSKQTSKPVRITVTFEDLSEEAQKDFRDYYRQGKLIISAEATWDPIAGIGTVKQFGQRMGMAAFKGFFKALGDKKPVSELKDAYESIRKEFPELPKPGPKDAMAEALHEYETNHPQLSESIESEDQFYGISRGTNRLERYIQWVCVPAVKDASTEQVEAKKTALGLLLERTVRCKISFKEPLGNLRKELEAKYAEIIQENQGALSELSKTLTTRLREWSHPDASLELNWQLGSLNIPEPLAQIAAGEGNFAGQLTRFGHGLQRSYLLALLQELSRCDDPSAPKLILACEEPEIYQHPPQARHLADVFTSLSQRNSQVIVCTHSPLFVSGRGVEDVRVVRKDPGGASHVTRVILEDVAARIAEATDEVAAGPAGMILKIEQALQPALNEMFFTPVLILVEGLEDLAYITSYLHLMGLWVDYRRLGCHVVPVGAKSRMIHPLALAKLLAIPTFVVFDSDGHKPDKSGSRLMHERDNKAILSLCSYPQTQPFPSETTWKRDCVIWRSEIRDIVREEIGSTNWDRLQTETRMKYRIDVTDLAKNVLYIAYILGEGWEQNLKSRSLETLCRVIIAFAEAPVGPPPAST
jgi:hypothetical protein